MEDVLIIDKNNYVYEFTHKLTYSSKNLDTNYILYFNNKNIDWIDNNNFIISGGSQNCVIEGKIYQKNGENKVLTKLYIWDNTLSGHITKTFVSVMKITIDSLNILRLCI
jgi:hypothetical protein